MSARRDLYAALMAGGPHSPDRSEKASERIDAFRAEVLAEGARLIEDAACDADWTRTPDYCAGLRAGAELLLANTGEEATAAAATATPGFFQVGHAYTHRHGYDFLCVAVTTHPATRERLAIGWHSEHGVPIAVGINQWNHEYDGAEAGGDRG